MTSAHQQELEALSNVRVDRLALDGPFEREQKTAASPNFEIEPLTAAHAAAFFMVREELQAPEISISRLESGPQAWQSMAKPNQDVAGPSGVSILVLREGLAIGEFERRPVELSAGDAVFIDHEKSFVLALGTYSATLFSAGRRFWSSEPAKAFPHGTILPHDYAMTRLFRLQMEATFRLGPKLPVSVFTSAVKALIDILEHAVTGRADLTDAGLPRRRRALRDRVSALIDANIENPQLAPQSIAKLMGTSRAALYRVFELDGGVAAFIQARRLDRSLTALHEPEVPRPTISTIAYRHGFNSEAHFSRAFKSRFGLTPTEARSVNNTIEAQNLMPQQPDIELVRRYMAHYYAK